MSAIIVIPKALRDPLGEEGAAALVEVINAAAAAQEKDTVENVGERLERRLAETKADLEKQIAETKADIIKWMFFFWLAQFGGGLIIWLVNRFLG